MKRAYVVRVWVRDGVVVILHDGLLMHHVTWYCNS